MLPVSEELLCYYVSFLGDKGLTYGTVKSYLAAIRDLQIEHGFQSPFDKDMPRLQRIIRGLRTIQGMEGYTPPPETPNHPDNPEAH